MTTQLKTMKPGYKQTDLGLLPQEWELTTLGELGTFFKGKGILKEELVESGLPCVRYGELYTNHEFFIDRITSFITEETAAQSAPIQNGDLLFAGSGETIEEIGKSAAYLGGEIAYAGGDVIVMRPNGNANSVLLAYLLETENAKKQKRRSGQGNSVVHIYPRDLQAIRLPLPPLPEQEAIAGILSTWEQAIKLTEALIAQKEKRKKWLMQQLLTGKKRLKGFGGEWKEFAYERLVTVVKRPVQWSDEKLYKLISVRRRSGGVFLRDALYGHQIKVKDLRSVKAGDFLFSKMQIVHGASALVPNGFEDAKISGSYIAVVAKDPRILNMEFLNWYSKQPLFYHQTLISSYGVHIEKMTFDFDIFLQLKMKLPAFEEQTAIVEILQTADREMDHLKSQVDGLKRQKAWLMAELLTGRRRVQAFTK